MTLKPQEPPGRITRKARQFETDIAVLRAQGYTLAAIREALRAAGVQVSISTVRREALRGQVRHGGSATGGTDGSSQTATTPGSLPAPPSAPAAAPAQAQPRPAVSAVSTVSDVPASQLPSGTLRGRDIAAAYASTWIDNPLIRARAQR